MPDQPTFNATSQQRDHETWMVEVSGEIDMVTAPKLQAVLDEVAGSQPSKVLLELKDVSFLDSSGIRVLVNAQNAFKQQGVGLAIDGMSGAVAQVLETSGLLASLTDGDS
jgi:anti-anti-sigma factor